MTNIWDEHWGEYQQYIPAFYHSDEAFGKWLVKMKQIGDELKVKAEKMEKYKQLWDIVMDANSEHQKKLEAVKTWEDDWGHHVNNNARLELTKILEDKE